MYQIGHLTCEGKRVLYKYKFVVSSFCCASIPSDSFKAMGRVSGDIRQVAFWLAIIFVILGAVLLAVAIYDPTSSDDHPAMGCIGITFTALAISLVAFLTYD